MIKTFKNKDISKLWATGKSRIDARLHKRILIRLNTLDRAITTEGLKIQGYDFNQPTQKIMDIPVGAKTPKQTLLFIGIVMVLLPLTIWVGIMKNLKGDDSELLKKIEKLPIRNKTANKDQDSYPKAS